MDWGDTRRKHSRHHCRPGKALDIDSTHCENSALLAAWSPCQRSFPPEHVHGWACCPSKSWSSEYHELGGTHQHFLSQREIGPLDPLAHCGVGHAVSCPLWSHTIVTLRHVGNSACIPLWPSWASMEASSTEEVCLDDRLRPGEHLWNSWSFQFTWSNDCGCRDVQRGYMGWVCFGLLCGLLDVEHDHCTAARTKALSGVQALNSSYTQVVEWFPGFAMSSLISFPWHEHLNICKLLRKMPRNMQHVTTMRSPSWRLWARLISAGLRLLLKRSLTCASSATADEPRCRWSGRSETALC